MTTLTKAMTIEVTARYVTGPGLPAGPEWLPGDYMPYDGTRRMYGWTGGTGGPAGDYSRPWSDKCVCNECTDAGPAHAQRIGTMCRGGPGQFIPATRPSIQCVICRRKAG